MDGTGSLSHTKWECKYHVVFIPKCRMKNAVRAIEAAAGGSIAQTGCAEGESD